MKKINYVAVILTACLSAMPSLASAEDKGVVYTGGSAGDGANGYLGGVIAVPGSRLGKGFALRAGVSGGEYRYDTNGQRIDATYIGGEVAVVYQFSGDWGWANVSAGPRVTDTTLKPDDPGNRARGTQFDVALQTDGSVGNAWRASWFASLGVDNRAYITQVRFGPLVDGEADTRLGIEGGIQGDRSYTKKSAGVFASTRLGGKWQGLLSGGVTDQKGRDVKPYVSLGISRVF